MYLLKLINIFVIIAISDAEFIFDDDNVGEFCYPGTLKQTRQSCECINVSDSELGVHAIHIDCSYKNLISADLSENLPPYVRNLDLSWNLLNFVLEFNSESLKLFNLMHNNITTIGKKKFTKLSNLRELYFSWNSIQNIELGAFDGLASLEILDLSHNNIYKIEYKVFEIMTILNDLNLSWNRLLNETVEDRFEFYETFGVNKNLKTLKLEVCGLKNLMLNANASLLELCLRGNKFTRIPINLPTKSLEKLDMSANLLNILISTDTLYMNNLEELYLEDMPVLREIGADSFKFLTSLQKVSFQNSRRLLSFHSNAFGKNSTKFPPLQSMIFRGTSMKSFNETLLPVFEKLTVLDLNGLPLNCDCNLMWIKKLILETNGRCFQSIKLRGRLLSNVRSQEFECAGWPEWVHGIILFILLILIIASIYFIVIGMRPNRGVTLRKKVGPTSPYARVTVEPSTSAKETSNL